jgi:hypothetical protein
MTSSIETAERKNMHIVVKEYESTRVNLVLIYVLAFLSFISMGLFALIDKSYFADLCIQFIHCCAFLYIGIRYANTASLLKKAKSTYAHVFQTTSVL